MALITGDSTTEQRIAVLDRLVLVWYSLIMVLFVRPFFVVVSQ